MQKSTKSGNENEPENAMSVDNENSSYSVDVAPSTSTKEITDNLASPESESETQFSTKKRKQPILLNVLERGLSFEGWL
ncbi:hypothetical protein EVAR_70813_1 [Eumeta japonica]|uniref:Uncharacterized protein n=1 Tax=Eumeta variegata TaxID=151549 RepID=A0A4C1TSH2_EUMVA|nr:hypothetical protein EVAR_70813_1 [Eumeta japonica]